MKSSVFARSIRRVALAALCVTGSLATGIASADELADQAVAILKNRCHSCHGVEYKYERLNVQDRNILVAESKEEFEDPFVTPGDIDHSKIWQVIEDERMPPRKALEASERDIIKQWIEAGAPWTVDETREFISEEKLLKMIERDLSDVQRRDQQFQRYFSLVHLHNNKSVTERDLNVYRAALSKAVNSMSSESRIVVPHAVDEAKTVFRIDMRHYGWDDSQWDEVKRAYPYGVEPTQNDEAQELFQEVLREYGALSGIGVPYIRADWFVVTATRPPLYHTLTKTPEQLDTLLKDFNVDIKNNFEVATSRRVGLFESGVSGQNRMIEYHSSTTGQFWISYDFKQKAGRSNLARFPLGPKFEKHPFDVFAFDHAGGEIIYSLPNGLHAYMLVTDAGDRIDEGPVDIVWDASNRLGSPVILNGISCMSCHKNGMLPLQDFVRSGHAVEDSKARQKILDLYPPQAEIDEAIEETTSRYLSSLRKAVGEYFEITEDRQLLGIEEPVSRVAMLYNKNLDLEAVACELGFATKEELKNQLNFVAPLGLGPLGLEGGTIKRSYWESEDGATSVLQDAASDLRLGSPIVL